VRNHLSQISGPVTGSFIYDALGRRTSKTIGASVTQFLYDGHNPLQELSAAGTVSANLLTGLNIDEYFTRADSGGAMAFLADALGSTVGLVNSAGSIATSYTYEPFGNTTASGNPNSNPYRFAGRENDATGLYFYRARYYSPTFQRFIEQDPIEFSGGDRNLHAYVADNPVNRKDPLGLFWWVVPISPGAGSPLYYAMHFQDDPMTNGNLPDSPGIYALPGLACGYLFCVVPDDQFNRALNPPDLSLVDQPIDTPMPDQPRLCQ
jgi:RHS repeat-associated protein